MLNTIKIKKPILGNITESIMDNEYYQTAVQAFENNKNAENDNSNKDNTNIHKKESNVIVVMSYHIAKQLVTSYGFFSALIGICKDKSDPMLKKRIWIFKKFPEIEQVFNNLVKQAREVNQAKEKNNG